MTLTHDIERLAAAGRIRSAWLPGMAFHENATPGMGLYRDGWGRVTELWDAVPNAATPDLTDPATLGCLLTLVREAWEDPTLSLVYDHDADTDSEQRHWCVCRVEPDGLAYRGSPEQTEATALTAAIHAAAEGLP